MKAAAQHSKVLSSAILLTLQTKPVVTVTYQHFKYKYTGSPKNPYKVYCIRTLQL